MPKLKTLSGDDVIRMFEMFGFIVVHRKGSHVKLGRKREEHGKQTLTIPAHKEIDKGTLIAIYRQAIKYIPEDDLRKYFYSE